MHPSGTVVRNCGPCPQPSIGTRSGGAWLPLRLCVFAPLRCVLPCRTRPFQVVMGSGRVRDSGSQQHRSRKPRPRASPTMVAWASIPRKDHSPSKQQPHNEQDARRTMGCSGWDSDWSSDRVSVSDSGSGSVRDSGSEQRGARYGHGHRSRPSDTVPSHGRNRRGGDWLRRARFGQRQGQDQRSAAGIAAASGTAAAAAPGTAAAAASGTAAASSAGPATATVTGHGPRTRFPVTDETVAEVTGSAARASDSDRDRISGQPQV
jgi:hypothetical protein